MPLFIASSLNAVTCAKLASAGVLTSLGCIYVRFRARYATTPRPQNVRVKMYFCAVDSMEKSSY